MRGFGMDETAKEDIDACIMSTVSSGRASVEMMHASRKALGADRNGTET
jgi:hypothetical protein